MTWSATGLACVAAPRAGCARSEDIVLISCRNWIAELTKYVEDEPSREAAVQWASVGTPLQLAAKFTSKVNVLKSRFPRTFIA